MEVFVKLLRNAIKNCDTKQVIRELIQISEYLDYNLRMSKDKLYYNSDSGEFGEIFNFSEDKLINKSFELDQDELNKIILSSKKSIFSSTRFGYILPLIMKDVWVQCKTKEEADKFIQIALDCKFHWGDRISFWQVEKENTIYNLLERIFDNSDRLDNGMIISLQEFDQLITKLSLKNIS